MMQPDGGYLLGGRNINSGQQQQGEHPHSGEHADGDKRAVQRQVTQRLRQLDVAEKVCHQGTAQDGDR